MILDLVEWAVEELPELGPPPRSVCDWLVDAAQDALERRDIPAALEAACELVLIANGERSQRPRPEGVKARGGAEARRARQEAVPQWVPVDQEPIVRYARNVLR